MLGRSVAGWALLAIARAAARVAVIPRPPAEVAAIVGRSLIVTVPWMLATPWLVDLAGRIALRRGRARVLLAHALTILACTLVDSVWSFLALRWTGQEITVGPALWWLGRLDQTLFLYLCLVAIGAAIRHRERLDRARARQSRLATQLLHARLHALSLQLHPHFLYNTLNAVSELVHRDAAGARETVGSLRELLRRTLDSGPAQEHSLREELALLEPYVRIQRTRFAGLTLRTEVEPDALGTAVPRLLLQPLVENAIRHGISRRAGPGSVTVRARREGERLVLEVEDDGVGSTADVTREGIGLGNTRARLRELHGEAAALTLRPGAGRGMVARVECPVREAVNGDPVDPTDGGGEPVGEHRIDPRRIPVLLAAGWLVLAVLGAHEDYLAGFLLGTPDPFLAVLVPRLGEALVWLGLTPAVVWLAHRLALASRGWARLAAGHLAGAAVISSAHLALTVRFISPDLSPNLVATVLVVDLALYAALAAAAHAWTLGRIAGLSHAEAARLEGELAAARLDLLRWQLRPELLFRALDTIGELATTDPAAADDLTGRLGELLRVVLQAGPASANRVPAEIESFAAFLDGAAGTACGVSA
ncbi:MAG TPA: histidine kinase [Gemmatimonadales bacterium]|nr:histidine kinase [Gemmatimonadales bacterium]